MSNPNFDPKYSTNEIFRDTNMGKCLTDDLDAMDESIAWKAPISHTHSEYAPVSHTHSEYAPTSHTHSEYAPTSHTHSEYAASDHTHTGYAAENHTHTEYAVSDHNHDSDYMDKSLQFTNDIGGVEYSYSADSGVNTLNTMAAWTQGVHTGYFAAGLTGNPPTSEAFRILMHKTSATIGWVVAFGSSGSVYTNYQNTATSFRGWKRLVEASPTLLWSGAKFMNDTQTITPSKPLSDCNNGWILEWCDYDNSTGTTNAYNYVHTPIFKRNVAGNWSGQNMMFTIPVYIANDGTAAVNTVKQLIVHNDKLVGHAANGLGTNNQDAVLRAVYEF